MHLDNSAQRNVKRQLTELYWKVQNGEVVTPDDVENIGMTLKLDVTERLPESPVIRDHVLKHVSRDLSQDTAPYFLAGDHVREKSSGVTGMVEHTSPHSDGYDQNVVVRSDQNWEMFHTVGSNLERV